MPLHNETIHVLGHGRVETSPTGATITLAIVQQHEGAGVAFASVMTLSRLVQEELARHHVCVHDIHTSQLSLQTAYAYDGGAPRRNGFEARLTLDVLCADLDNLEAVLTAVVHVGAAEIQGVAYQSSHLAALMDEAWRQAVLDGHRRANLLAQAAGVELGPVLTLDAACGAAVPSETPMLRMSADSAVPMGEVTSTATVRMTFALIGRV